MSLLLYLSLTLDVDIIKKLIITEKLQKWIITKRKYINITGQ